MRKLSFAERLEKNSIPEPNSGCLLWTGSVDHSGHGVISYSENGQKFTISAHRAAWIVAHGPIPTGLCVCHSCDVPSCVNGSHLWLGSNAENMADMAVKGRADRRPGEKHPMAKITDDVVRDIRTSSLKGIQLAKKYDISPSSVCFIRKGVTWRHVEP